MESGCEFVSGKMNVLVLLIAASMGLSSTIARELVPQKILNLPFGVLAFAACLVLSRCAERRDR